MEKDFKPSLCGRLKIKYNKLIFIKRRDQIKLIWIKISHFRGNKPWGNKKIILNIYFVKRIIENHVDFESEFTSNGIKKGLDQKFWINN